MTHSVFTLSLGVAAILLATPPVHAQTARNCADHQIVVERLAERYGETRQSIGLATNNQVVEVFASLDTGTWTITVTSVSGLTCLVAAGGAFERLDEALSPAMLGRPA